MNDLRVFSSQSLETNAIDCLKSFNTMSDKKWRQYFIDQVYQIIDDSIKAEKIANSIENMIATQVDKQLVYDKTSGVSKEVQETDSFDPILGTIEFLRYMIDSNIIKDHEAKVIKDENPLVDYEKFLTQFIKKYNPQ